VPLAETSRSMVNNAIDSFHSIFNFISVEFMSSDFSKRVQGPLNDEMDMMYRLYLGSLKERAIQGEIDQGIYDSLQMPSWYSYKEKF
jgi:hypothetical protein